LDWKYYITLKNIDLALEKCSGRAGNNKYCFARTEVEFGAEDQLQKRNKSHFA
jgi:hypothetical protein